MADWVISLRNALLCDDVEEKLFLVSDLPEVSDQYSMLESECSDIVEPGRPERPLLVPPKQVPKRKLGSDEGRAAFLHAIAHIEFNAINLALDAALRFPGLPARYYNDWVNVAKDEARHFRWLVGRMQDFGCQYGDVPAHNGLWEMALKTRDDFIARMALVPRYLEARGLDVTPGMIQRLEQLGDTQTAEILRNILQEEIPHVAVGTRWFHFACEQQGKAPDETFNELLRQFLPAGLSDQINREARLEAGFSEQELALITA